MYTVPNTPPPDSIVVVVSLLGATAHTRRLTDLTDVIVLRICFFPPAAAAAIATAAACTTLPAYVQLGQKYHVLCVLTDGIINDMVRQRAGQGRQAKSCVGGLGYIK